jgi:SAM-dependent methyltransferase
LPSEELETRFWQYFGLFPFQELSQGEGFDLGCGSGRWSALVAPRVGKLHCVDPAGDALNVARRALKDHPNVDFHEADAHNIPLPDESQDFGYSLGVLHHIPDPEAAMAKCVQKLKPGAPFLVYLYYNFENRPGWFKAAWKASDIARQALSRAPFGLKKLVTSGIAATVYYPLARAALLLERAGKNVNSIPLSPYREWSFYSMRTDALDRFGTRLEHRFSRADIRAMMERCGLSNIQFSDEVPYWVAIGRKS